MQCSYFLLFISKRLSNIKRYGSSEINEAGDNSIINAILNKIESNKSTVKKRKVEDNTQSPEDISDETIETVETKKSNKRVKLDSQKKESKTETRKANTSEQGDTKDLGFTVLGKTNEKSKAEVKRILPKWLSKPSIIPTNLTDLHLKVSDLKVVNKRLRKLLSSNGVEYFFPVQGVVIPWILESHRSVDLMFPRDVCVSSPTGSGKTLAFVLPVVQLLEKHTVKETRALVILPTQELANQVYLTFKKYTQNTKIATVLLSNKCPFVQEQRQLFAANDGFGIVSKFDIVVCTAGRLVDHIKNTRGFNLQHLEFLVIDEADRVLNSMQNDWLYHLQNHIKGDFISSGPKILNLQYLHSQKRIRKLLFSATLSQDPEKLQKLSLFQPKLFTSIVETDEDHDVEEQKSSFIGKYTTPKELREKYIISSAELKPLVLYKFIQDENLRQILVFTHSVESVKRLAILLKELSKNKLKVKDISSNLPAKERSDCITEFVNKEIDILVCTDSLARGMDLPDVQCVISYSMPKYIKTYIHRVGRTARAGNQGLAVTLVQENQRAQFKSLLAQADKTKVDEVVISDEALEPLGELYNAALQKLKKTVDKQSEKQIAKVKSVKSKLTKLKKK